MNLIQKHIEVIKTLCEQHKVERLYVFGSVLTDKFNENSDVDFLVKFGEVDLFDYFDNYMNLKEALEKLLQRPVDLLEEQTLKNPILKKSINKTKKLIYGGAGRKVAA
ncbi:MAG: nucleotidyltransferase domain-containing protein [Hymenobacteraceae bacterium]|nr:nucleotidyltransferase domain-containing protein [Hymenobacteraceae bacterium]MDX5395234.1 nucleotidyltransferase domain-containing protein [Hymenobacteraceae bacterium]MDX5511272.1 nucleotidyltransferase domain-containing protein [Hymenobacteraceae bacterium]